MPTTKKTTQLSKSLRIAYVLGGLPFGGIENWLLELCLEYGRNNLVLPRVFNLSGTGMLLPEYQKKGIDVHCIADNIRAISSHRLDTAFALRKELLAFSPDIIHTCHFSANHLGRIAALKTGIPLILHLHNTKHEKRLERRTSDKLLSFATTRYLAVSKAVADVVQSDHNIAKRPVDVIYNAIAPSSIDTPPIDCKAEFGISSPIIIAVGRYAKVKNFDLLIRAVSILHKKGVKASLLLVGEGPERANLEALRSELGLDRHVILTGFRNDVGSFLKASDIFAMPSEIEGFLIAHLEAMACGLPAVLSKNVPSIEIASEACLISETEPNDIAEKLSLLLQNDTLRQKLSTAALDVSAPLTMDNYARVLYEYYQAILGNQPFSSINSPLWVTR